MSTNQADEIHTSIISSFLQLLKNEGKLIKSHQLQTDVIRAGNNFCSGISKLKVKYEQDGATFEKSYILKIPSVSNFYKQLTELNMYQNEVLMYSNILPAMCKLLNCNLTPASYLLSDTDNLILEDLNERGYVLMDKKNQLDLEHSLAALMVLAKFHAVTVKLYETSKQTIDLIVVPPRENIKNDAPSKLFDKFNNTVEVLPLPKKLRQKVQEFQFKHIPEAFNETMVPSEEFNVLCHGDFWLGNLLFQHDQQRQVRDVKILDFQMVHRCSPVIDLIEFFVTSVHFDVYKTNRDTLIDSYLKIFNEVLSSLGSAIKYTKDDLTKDMQRHKLFYLYNMGAYMPAVLNDKEDPFNFSGKDTQIYTSDLYKDALLKWINHLNDENML